MHPLEGVIHPSTCRIVTSHVILPCGVNNTAGHNNAGVNPQSYWEISRANSSAGTGRLYKYPW